MAGDIKRQRKTWTLQDRSKVSLNILRANYAEEGDENAQLEVAKRLLEEESTARSLDPVQAQNENARKALYWLIKSSEQGNDEATQLLRECLRTGRGITAQNILDVRNCVTTPKYEKLTFKAARVLHNMLSNGEEFITTTQLLSRVNMSRRNMTLAENSNGAAIVHRDELFPNEDNNVENNSSASSSSAEQSFDNNEVERNSLDNSVTAAASPLPPPAPHPGARKYPPRNSELNQTFVIQSNLLNSSSAPSSVRTSPNTPNQPGFPSFLDRVQPTLPPPQPVNNHNNVHSLNRNSHSHHQHRSSAASEHQNEVKLAMAQTGKKLTLNDLLDVAKDFNLGKSPQVSVDAKNRILGRHVWHANSFLNTFVLQLLFLAIAGNVVAPLNALTYLILFGTLYSSYNLLCWGKRFLNFKDWELAFRSVLQEETWKTEKFTENLSKRYLLPHLMNMMMSLIFFSYFSPENFLCYFVTVAIPAMTSVQFGIQQRTLPGWRQILILCTAIMHYCPSSNLTHVLSENMTEQTKFLHESLSYFVARDSIIFQPPFAVNGFTVVSCIVLATAVKRSLDRIVYETLPEIVLSLWLIKFVQTFVILDAPQFVLGCGAGIFLTFGMILFCSKVKMWKVFTTSSVMIIATIVIILAFPSNNYSSSGLRLGTQEETNFLEWEEYEVSCHRKAWTVQSPAATQIKCSNMYESRELKWKARVSIVRVEKLSRSSFITNNAVNDVVFDISVGIITSGGQEDGARNWQSFLSSSSGDSGDSLPPASVIVSTEQIRDRRKKQNLIDHILNLRSGDKIEFVGKLKGFSAGSLKPQIEDIQSLQCLSCATADYGEFTFSSSVDGRNNEKSKFSLEWLGEFLWNYPRQVEEYPFIGDCKNIILDLYSTMLNTFGVSEEIKIENTM